MLAAAGTATPPGPWRRALDGHGEARVGAGAVAVGDRTWHGAALQAGAGDGEARIALDGVLRRYAVAVGEDAVWIARDGHHLEVRTRRRARSGAQALAGSLDAPMPGTVLLVPVADGDAVAAGDVLVVLESMKMELAITAPHPGVVAGLDLAPGDRVGLRQPLVAVVPHEEDPA
jgi:acetyl/propionyl-CoA carboxylase alpha subunit